jgi:hypothetical protein
VLLEFLTRFLLRHPCEQVLQLLGLRWFRKRSAPNGGEEFGRSVIMPRPTQRTKNNAPADLGERNCDHALHQPTFVIVADRPKFSRLSSPPSRAVWNVCRDNRTKPFRKGIARILTCPSKLPPKELREKQRVFNSQIQLKETPHVRPPEPFLN